MITLDKSGKIPLYYQIVDAILKRIENEELPEHTKLFTERELCETLKVSRATVRQAISILERDGYIYRIQGSGTFVAPKKIEQNLENFYSFADEIKKVGMKPSSRVISLELVTLPGHLASKLGYPEAEKFYRLTRVRLANDEPIVYEETYLPPERFLRLDETRIEREGLYNFLREVYGAKLDYAVETFSVCSIDENIGKYIGESTGAPAMRLERTTYENERVVEYTESIAKGNKFKFTTILKNI